jgi:hypothetical protein
LREHRQDRLHELDREAGEPHGAFGERCTRHFAEASGRHCRAPHLRRADVGRGRNRVQHESAQSALPQLAHEQSNQKVLLFGDGA